MTTVRKLLAVLLAFWLTGCVPVATATIDIGLGGSIADVEKAEAIVEAVGLSRIWFEPPGGQHLKRAEHADEFVSNFEVKPNGTFGASVVLRKRDGRLRVLFAERNNKISEKGRGVLNQLVQDLRGAFGENVAVSEP